MRFLLLIKLSVAVGILYYIFTVIPFSEVITAMVASKVGLIAIAFLILVFERYAAAARMKFLTDKVGMSLSVFEILEISLISTFYGMFLPGQLGGGVVRWYKMSQPGKKRAEAFAAITFDRLVDTIGLVLVGLVFWFLESRIMSNHTIGISFFAILVMLLLILLLALSPKMAYLLLVPLERYHGVKICQWLHSKIKKLLNSVIQYREFSLNSVMAIGILTMVRCLLSIAILYALALSLDMTITFVGIGLARCFVAIATMIPITFSGLGIREVSLIYLLQPYGVSGTQAVALSFLSFVMLILSAALGGLFELKNILLVDRRKEGLT